MFYTKYRPQKFSEISKPNDTAEALLNQLQSGKVAHAYLLVGSRGTGKTTTARILAKGLNCLKPDKNGDPCDSCANCNAIATNSFTDLVEIDAASNRGIDDIRDLRERVKLAPVSGKHKVYIIDEVHMLTSEAFNALLKTLEEPPKRVCFILCTTEFHKVPDTIKSRCQVFKFKRASISQIIAKLEKISDQEGAKITKDQLKIIAKASLGGFRDAETLLQQVVEGSIEPESLKILSSREGYIDFLDLLYRGNLSECLRMINKSYEDGVDMFVWSGELISYLRTLLFVKAGVTEMLDDESDFITESATRQSKTLDYSFIVYAIEKLVKAQSEIKTSQIPQLPIEVAVLSIIAPIDSGFDVSNHNNSKETETKTPKVGDILSDNSETNIAPSQVKPKPLSMKRGDIKSISVTNKKADISLSDNTNLTAKKKIVSVSLEEIQEKWLDIVNAVDRVNSTIATLLRNSKAVDSNEGGIELEVAFAFHKDRIESPKNKKLIESIIEQVLGKPQYITCKLDTSKPRKTYSDKSERETGILTDRNVVAPTKAPVEFSGNILDVFDGGLPLAA